MKLIFKQKEPVVKPNLPIEAEIISPDNLVNLDLEEISNLTVWRKQRNRTIWDIQYNTGG